MTNMESRVLDVVWDHGGSTSVSRLSQCLGVSTNYARLICVSLGRSEYINFDDRRCALLGKGKLEVAKRRAQASGTRPASGDETPALEELQPPSRGCVVEY